MLARDLALGLDAARFMESCGTAPDPWQAELLRSTALQSLLLCSRQSGKSTATAALAVHEALYRAPALVLLLSPSMRQSQELFRKVERFCRGVEAVEPEQESASRIELANGSRIMSLPGTPDTIRGLSEPRLIILDEAAWVADDLYFAVRPMLAVSGGRLVAMSTPNGQRGWFWEAWERGGDDWHRIKVTADQCPRIPAAFLESERAAMPEWRFRQEYECAFVDTEDAVFSSDLIRAALTPDVSPLFASIQW